eukprot:TRINITY_DN47322_c0_g1_i1.p1 TRINITY_DN47322_c0_g1~~TRINITY_DN47322_c0_g1_i1.p1  ORF type:complete len:460 (+),score=173.94 TRINITY_DN47322_c0_g1_i1:108-1382(+)
MGKGTHPSADGRRMAGTKQKEIFISGAMVDVTAFRHPGGSIINFLSGGGDATDAFREFHGHSKRADRLLASLPQRPATAAELQERRPARYEQLSSSYQRLRRELVDAGYFRPSLVHIAYRLAEIVLLHALGLWLLMGFASVAVRAAGLLLLGVVQGRCGWLMHEAGHYSFTKVAPLDRALQAVLYGAGCGMSAGWWRSQHNRHHATPQKLHHDVDLETLPLVSFNHGISKGVRSPVLLLWLRAQAALFFPVVCTLVALGWQFFLHPRYIMRQRKWDEALSLAARYLFIFRFALAAYSWPAAIGLYVAYVAVGGGYIFTNFALSHTHLDVTHPDEYIHWVEYAGQHTTNITPHPVTTWWMSYLNYQIEHHLFPQMPQYHMPKVAPIVRAWFKENGLRYDERGYWSCCYDTFSNLHNVGATAGTEA